MMTPEEEEAMNRWMTRTEKRNRLVGELADVIGFSDNPNVDAMKVECLKSLCWKLSEASNARSVAKLIVQIESVKTNYQHYHEQERKMNREPSGTDSI